MIKPIVKVYIDGANMFYTQKKLGWFFDWQKVKSLLESKYEIKQITFYIGEKKDDQKMQSFLSFLKKLNFNVITKPVKLIKSEENPRGEEKANFDVEITRDILFDLLYYKNKGDGFIFLSGDSDFASLFWDLKNVFKKKIYVYSSRQTLSWELRLAATDYFCLEDFKKAIFRGNWGLTEDSSRNRIKPSNRRSS